MGCSGLEQSQQAKLKRLHCKAEPVLRSSEDFLYHPQPLKHKRRKFYPWESETNLPKITKDFFRCKGSVLNSAFFDPSDSENSKPISDCGGSTSHGFPILYGKENVYPALIELLNFVQKKTGKRVIITSGYRCPEHNTYADPRKEARVSKHQIGAEVDFYVQGMEERPLEIVGILMQYYREKPIFSKDRVYKDFISLGKEGGKKWKNREISIRIYEKDEGRDGDNQHPHPYICVQILQDRKTKERVEYSWKKAHLGYVRQK